MKTPPGLGESRQFNPFGRKFFLESLTIAQRLGLAGARQLPLRTDRKAPLA
jgi:hypothetical protein